MKALSCCLLLALLAVSVAAGPSPASSWSAIDAVAEETIAAGNVPGVVFVVGHRGKIVYRKAFGSRSLQPEKTPMTPDTAFDLASLTKVIATTSAVMDLMQQGKLRPNDPAARYWPEFGQNGKERVTIRQLMTHTSGLSAFVNYYTKFGDPKLPGVQDHYEQVTAAIAALPLSYPTDTRQVYSDLGFITLGEVVRRVSGETLDRYVKRHVFEPLGMKETTYNPGPDLCARAAPTTVRAGRMMQGEVHDPNAAVCGGVAGHAGLFSTADDLARFARMLLSSDETSDRHYPLSPATVRKMTSPATPPGIRTRGLGWDIDSTYSHVRGDLLPIGSFGHTGFTGTYIWVDPYSRTFIIGLSNRVHPDEKGSPLVMWARVANIVAGIVHPQALPERPAVKKERVPVLTGLDVLQRDGFKLLQGRKVGYVTNRTGINRARESGIDLLRAAPGVEMRALFSPEHGLRSDVDEPVASSRDEKTGLPIHSLYGENRKPTPEQLQGLDTLVFDIQDVGVRYYTYITTLGLCMEAAAASGVRFVVLDRPNPNNGLTVDGPLLDPERRNFAGYYRLPVRHGMTVGELARLYNEEFKINCDLTVVPMENWQRRMWWDDTGLPWVDPSPNIRCPRQAELYTGIGLIEASRVSVGRGTDTPFERFGAPWIDGSRLAEELNRRELPGLVFTPIVFTPTGREFKGERCGGVDVRLTDRSAFEGCRTALELLDALERLYPGKADVLRNRNLWGTERVLRAVLAGTPVSEVVASYQDDVREFLKTRQKYLLYR